MGNKNGKLGYYGVGGEGISSFEDGEGFVVVSVSPPSKVEDSQEAATGHRSPFEPTPAVKRVAEERTNLEGSVDSGYDDLHAANKCNSEKTTPEHVPGKPIKIVSWL